MSDKVYCKNCSHFRSGEAIPFSYGPPDYDRLRELCLASENFKDSHKEEAEMPISRPEIINRFNDCVWYDAIEEGISSSSSSSSSSSGIVDMP